MTISAGGSTSYCCASCGERLEHPAESQPSQAAMCRLPHGYPGGSGDPASDWSKGRADPARRQAARSRDRRQAGPRARARRRPARREPAACMTARSRSGSCSPRSEVPRGTANKRRRGGGLPLPPPLHPGARGAPRRPDMPPGVPRPCRCRRRSRTSTRNALRRRKSAMSAIATAGTQTTPPGSGVVGVRRDIELDYLKASTTSSSRDISGVSPIECRTA
jgi:hypothetical protein